ncbi:MAG: hypothetical protein PHE58_01720 [Candidatus Omnitrophica bacterium]|nr:hypothetical protein [Candidatus Omnitrophota bacterium]
MLRRFQLLFGICCAVFLHTSITQAVDISIQFPTGSPSIQISKIIANSPFNGTTDTWPAKGSPSESSFGFGALKELTDPQTGEKLGVFGPADRRYYAIDLGVSGGGTPTNFDGFQISYRTNSSSAVNEGDKIVVVVKTMTFVDVGKNPTEDPRDIVLLKNVSSIKRISASDFQGHWIRLYIGIITNPKDSSLTGVPGVDSTKPTNVFTSGDAGGSYSGTFTISSGGVSL